jgi:hypothetical protein
MELAISNWVQLYDHTMTEGSLDLALLLLYQIISLPCLFSLSQGSEWWADGSHTPVTNRKPEAEGQHIFQPARVCDMAGPC